MNFQSRGKLDDPELGVKKRFDAVQGWEFEVDEVSAGVYKVVGTSSDGRRVELSDTDYEALLQHAQLAALALKPKPPSPDREGQRDVIYQCIFCGAGITPGEHDPCAIVVVTGIDRPRAAQKEQTFYCHLGCLQTRASIHSRTFYIADPDFPTVRDAEVDGAPRPEKAGQESNAPASVGRSLDVPGETGASMSNGACDRFAVSASRFCEFVETRGEVRARVDVVDLIELLCDLVSAAVALPVVEPDNTEPAGNRVSVARSLLFTLPRLYWDVYDPFDGVGEMVTPQPSLGDLADDVGDIYRDISDGLSVWREATAAASNEAVWRWKFTFESHWGRHATSAIRALYCVLDRLPPV